MISDRIFNLLKEKEMTQKEFSERTGIAQSTISDWKKKGNSPSADKILTICEVLEVSPYYLLSDSRVRENADGSLGYFVSRDSDDGKLIEVFHNMKSDMKQRLMGYAIALSEMNT